MIALGSARGVAAPAGGGLLGVGAGARPPRSSPPAPTRHCGHPGTCSSPSPAGFCSRRPRSAGRRSSAASLATLVIAVVAVPAHLALRAQDGHTQDTRRLAAFLVTTLEEPGDGVVYGDAPVKGAGRPRHPGPLRPRLTSALGPSSPARRPAHRRPRLRRGVRRRRRLPGRGPAALARPGGRAAGPPRRGVGAAKEQTLREYVVTRGRGTRAG